MSDKENSNLLDRIVDDHSRRNFLKKGAITTTGLGIAATGTAAAQDDDGEDPFPEEDQVRVAVFKSDFRPNARFLITSGIIDYTPKPNVDLGGQQTEFNTHMATYINTGERFPIFVRVGEDLGAEYNEDSGWFVDDDNVDYNQPALYEFESEYSAFERTDRIVTTFALPLEQSVEDQVFAPRGWENEEDINDFLF